MMPLLLDSRRQESRLPFRERAGKPAGADATIVLRFSMPARTGIDLKPTNRDFGRQAKPLCRFRLDYLSAVETDEKVVFRFVPRPCTTAMIAT